MNDAPPDSHQGVGAPTIVLRCAIPAPLMECLDYLPPPGIDQPLNIPPGTRVRVPLGRRTMVGVVLQAHQSPGIAPDKLRAAEALLDDAPVLDNTQLELLSWAARYYKHPPGETVALGLAPRERRGEPPAPTGNPGVALNLRGTGLPEGGLKRAPKQRALLAALQDRPHSFAELESLGISRAVVRALLDKHLVEHWDIPPTRDWQVQPALAPSSEQAAAIAAIQDSAGSFTCHLLEGVTGSGKTEVYLQCIAPLVERGRQVLVLLPEIGLTPQMIQRFEARFQAPIAVLHSGLAEGERDRNWSMARRGEAAIVLGTRSAVFTPIPRLDLIIVDEEHDTSFKQQDGLRYSGRDVAVKRAQLTGCPIVLGSATPSLESIANAEQGRYRHHPLTRRAGGASQPDKDIVDVRGLDLDGGISQPLKQRMDHTLGRGEQVLLFLNRRGFAGTLLCHDCGWVAECSHCDARMTLHRTPAELRCHHCNSRNPLPRTCPSCNGRRLVSSGLGTEQTEQALRRLYPDTPVFRVDSDTMTGRHAMTELTRDIDNAGPCIILGTQMLTKGHHLPGVTLVGVIDADALLFNPDFRGEERLLQLLTQVGGRSGRGSQSGQVLIQTRHPEHPLITTVLEQPFAELARALLAERRTRGLPPEGAMTLVRCDSHRAADGFAFLEALLAGIPRLPDTTLIGPLPAAMARRAGYYRCQILVLCHSRRALSRANDAITRVAQTLKAPAKLRWFLDVDPTDSI